jgi:Uma2 family endonuclease
MAISPQKLTFEEYLVYEDGSDIRYELADGEPVAISIGTGVHVAIVCFLLNCFDSVLFDLLETHKVMAWIGVRSPGRLDTSRIPDVTILPLDQLKAMWDRAAVIGFDEAPPPLVIEVVGSSTRTVDYRAKRAEYNAREIPEYWIVDPLSELITICLLEDGLYTLCEFRGDETLRSPLFPSFNMTAAQILAAGL